MRKTNLSFLYLISLLMSARCFAADASGVEALSGVWGVERTLGPSVRGTLSIDSREADWRAQIAGYTVSVQQAGDEISLTLPADQGKFRGRLLKREGVIVGNWIQPPTVTTGDRYATPVRLKQSADRIFRGEVRSFEDQFALYLVINSEGRAFIRDPNRNIGLGRNFTVSRVDERVILSNVKRESDRLEGSFDAQADRLTLRLANLGVVELTRRTRDSAPGFYPATPANAHYTYRAPTREEDGWETAALNGKSVEPLIQRILDSETGGYTAPYIQSLLMAQHGKLVLEEYFYGFHRERAHDLRSASKTITGALVGIALDHGAPFGLDTEALKLFPDYSPLPNPDPRKQQIKVRDLLAMNSGLACDDNDEASPGNEDKMYDQTAELDYYRYTLSLPMSKTPGDGVAVYCTAGINLLGGIVRNASRMPLVDFFQRYFAEPLDIHTYQMNLAASGDAYMGGGLYLRPRDALKLGQLYLAGGKWRGRQVISKKWTELSTQRHASFPASDFAAGHDYGFAWHLFEVTAGERRYREYMAQGNGGQLIIVIPELDLVVMFTAGNYNNFKTWQKFYEELLPTYLIKLR